jgi:molybdenum cofactor biosynthesis protein MoaC
MHNGSSARYLSTTLSVPNSTSPSRLTHIDETGRPSMVDVSSKSPTKRTATARGRILLPPVAFDLITPTPSSTAKDLTHTVVADADLERAKAKAKAKGDVLMVAQLAGIMAAKRTSDLIPLCHPLALSHVSVVLTPQSACTSSTPSIRNYDNKNEEAMHSVLCEATVTCEGKTGVEMEALTAVSVGLLTVWDMVKAVAGKDMIIKDMLVSSKSGGKSGDFTRDM